MLLDAGDDPNGLHDADKRPVHMMLITGADLDSLDIADKRPVYAIRRRTERQLKSETYNLLIRHGARPPTPTPQTEESEFPKEGAELNDSIPDYMSLFVV